MDTYVSLPNSDKNDYVKFKQHLLTYTGKLINPSEYYSDVHRMCNQHTLDDEIKTAILDMIILNKIVSLNTVLGYKHMPTDKQLDALCAFNDDVWQTWPHFTFAAVRYIHRVHRFEKWLEFLTKNISKIVWDEQCFAYVCTEVLDVELIKKILKTGVQLSSLSLIAAYHNHNIPLIELHNMPITPECIVAASNSGFKNDKFVLDLVAKLPLTIDTLTLMIKIKRCTPKHFKNILQHVQFVQEHVKLACTYHRLDLIQLILNYRLSVDNECFELMFFTDIEDTRNNIETAIEQFILAGYQLTYEDVVRLARRQYCVRDINRFNFTIDNTLIEACILNECLDYDLPYTIDSLRLACTRSSIIVIYHIIKKGVTPDRQCLINALGHSNIVELLMPYVPLDAELTYQLINRKLITNSTIKY